MTDAALLAAVARGEPMALARLHERHAHMVRAVAMRVVADPVEAEEIAQECFLRLWLRAETFDPARGGGGAWLRRIAHNLAITHARRRQAAARLTHVTDDWAEVVGNLVDPAIDVEGEVWAAERRQTVAAALAELPAAQRTVILQAYYSGLSHRQIATGLGVPLGTVKSRLALALRRLRALLESDEPRVSGAYGGWRNP
jgi:RNA polymerase sigma-70 factor (ECF subfamily)